MNLSRTLSVKTTCIAFHHMNSLVKVLLNTNLLFNAPEYGIKSLKQKLSYTEFKMIHFKFYCYSSIDQCTSVYYHDCLLEEY
jgi:hypothetical protein